MGLSACLSTSVGPSGRAKLDVGGRGLWVQVVGSGGPAVIFESGLGNGAGIWDRVEPAVRARARTVVYSRAGLDFSDPPKSYPRTSRDMAADLHQLLRATGTPPPYVLVAHSIGAFNVRVYAATWPDEVSGMVLVEGSHPDQWSAFDAVIPSPSKGEDASLPRWRTQSTTLRQHPADNQERWDVLESAAQVKGAPGLGDLPLAVVTRSPSAPAGTDLPPALDRHIAETWQGLQDNLATLSSVSRHTRAVRSGHFVQREEPSLVIEAILWVLDRAHS